MIADSSSPLSFSLSAIWRVIFHPLLPHSPAFLFRVHVLALFLAFFCSSASTIFIHGLLTRPAKSFKLLPLPSSSRIRSLPPFLSLHQLFPTHQVSESSHPGHPFFPLDRTSIYECPLTSSSLSTTWNCIAPEVPRLFSLPFFPSQIDFMEMQFLST